MIPADPAVAGDEKSRALEEVLKSRTLARSEQLQGFLRYICEMELAGRGDEISEYSIATHALNRKADYAPGEDSSVRSRAHALRRKLQEYYDTESPDTEWRIDLPKGSYRPLFVNRNHAPQPIRALIKPKETTQQPGKQAAGPQLRAFLYGVLFALLLSSLAVALLGNRFRADPIDPIVREAWGPLLQTGSDNLILLGIPALARIIPSQPGAFPNGGGGAVPAPDSIAKWYTRLNLANRGGPVYLSPSRGYMAFSDNLATVTTTTLLNAARIPFQVATEIVIRPMAIHSRGLVAIGSPSYTPYVARILQATPFSIQFDPALNDEVITDGPPGSAVRRVFAAKRDTASDRFSTVYGLITVLPAQPGRERPERTVVFSGVKGSPGAQAAALFFTSPNALHDLQRRFREQGYKQFPPAYQVVVRCGVDVETAMNTVYETHRVMTTPPVLE
jgi:hypothetical protein